MPIVTSHFWLRHSYAVFLSSVNPQLNSLVSIGERRCLGVTMSHTTRQLRHFGNENIVLVTPVNNYFVFVHFPMRGNASKVLPCVAQLS